jgi:hypothetical protein
MPRVFDVDHVLHVPGPAQHAVLLSARRDLDLATADAARSEMLDACAGGGAAVLVDVTGVFVGVVLIRCLVDLAERAGRAGKPIVLIGAPGWLVDLQPPLHVPSLPLVATVGSAVATLRAACGAATAEPAHRIPVVAAAG